MNWEGAVLLPLLSLLCALYIYALFLQPADEGGAVRAHNRVVIPPDSKQSFDRVLERLRSSGSWSTLQQDDQAPSAARDDDLFFTEIIPRGPRESRIQHAEIEPSEAYECQSGFVAFKSEFTLKYLWSHAVEQDGWLSAAASVHTPVCLRAFEATPIGNDCVDGNGYVSLKDVSTGLTVRGSTVNEENAWVVYTEEATKISSAHHFLLEKDGFIYHKNAKAVVNVVLGDYSPIRLHDNFMSAPQPANRDSTARFQMEWLRASEIDSCRAQLAAEKVRDEQQEEKLLERIGQLPVSTERRYISFGLYGANPKYTVGAIRNAELATTFFPGWKLRYYVKDDVPQATLTKLASLPHVEIVNGQSDINGAAAGMFWRFLIADDPNVDRFIVRDVDSRLNARDRLAVQEWIESRQGVHIIRDHVNHCIAMNGGMWGAKHGAVTQMLKKIREWQDTQSYGADLHFLQAMVWPDIMENQMSHDSYCCLNFPNTKGFPTKRPHNYQHVGQVFDAFDKPRVSDIDGFIRGVETPPACRRKPKWHYG